MDATGDGTADDVMVYNMNLLDGETWPAANELLLNDGAGSFTRGTLIAKPNADSDRHLVVFTDSQTNSHVFVLRVGSMYTQAKATFTRQATIAGSVAGEYLYFGTAKQLPSGFPGCAFDVNHDGLLDIMYFHPHLDTGRSELLLGHDTGAFTGLVSGKAVERSDSQSSVTGISLDADSDGFADDVLIITSSAMAFTAGVDDQHIISEAVTVHV